MRTVRSFKIAIASILFLCLATTTIAAQEKTGSQKTSQEAVASTERGGVRDGIKVHGHWVIEVRNPSGKLVEHREFENALTGFGAESLSNLLGRRNSVGYWSILVDGNPSPCRLSGIQGAFACSIIEAPQHPGNGTSTFPTLSVSVPATGENAGKLVLSGNFTAGGEANINRVNAQALICAPTAAPSAPCNANTAVGGITTSEVFTDRFLQNPISVVAGQIVQVTVVISFS